MNNQNRRTMYKMAMSITVCFLMIGHLCAQSVIDREGVRSALMDYIEAFYDGDSSKITRSVSPKVAKYGFWKRSVEAPYQGMPMSYQQMIDYVLKIKTSAQVRTLGDDEKIEIFEVKDKTASGKVTAWWGSDYILLHKENDKWIIDMILWQSPEK